MASTRKPQLSRTTRRVPTAPAWGELVLDPAMRAKIDGIPAGMKSTRRLRSPRSPAPRRKPARPALFHGPSGTGKTLAAALLGKEPAKPVYRLDLSQVVSRYIGETEKNLAALFAKAESLDAILILDEADALFTQRTEVRDAHDRYANAETAYLLQRIEQYEGIVILTTNLSSKLDDAFTRRLKLIIELPKPTATDRQQLWRNQAAP